MKANRKFVQADEAVSPVIAVILMVAITVVLAATVFVLVSDIGGNTSKTAPQIGWSDSEVDDEWTISQAPQQVNWDEFKIKSNRSVAGLVVSFNGGTGVAVTDAYETPTNFATTMEGGDALSYCATAEEEDVLITLLHIESNSVAHQFAFDTLDAC